MTEFHMVGVDPQRGEYRFTVKEKADGMPWLVGEPVGVPLRIIGTTGDDLQVGFDLVPGTTLDEAQAIARTMNDCIARIVLF